jgi:hypothetical protein
MPRAVSTLTGLLVVATVAYKYRYNVASETAEIRDRLQNVKSTLDDVAAGTVHKVNVANDSFMFLIGYKPLLFHLPPSFLMILWWNRLLITQTFLLPGHTWTLTRKWQKHIVMSLNDLCHQVTYLQNNDSKHVTHMLNVLSISQGHVEWPC